MKNRTKNEVKKILSVLLSVAIIATAAPVATFSLMAVTEPVEAKAETSSSDFDYVVVSESETQTLIELVDYSGSDKEVVIPSEIDGCKVVGLSGTFDGNRYIESVTVPEGVENIDDYCFRKFSGTVNLPSSIKNIGEGAFYGAVLECFSLSEGLVSIARSAFDYCEFYPSELVLPDSLEYIADMSFKNSYIEKIHIGSNLRIADVGYYSYGTGSYCYVRDLSQYSAMFNSADLTEIEVDEANPYLRIVDNVLYSKDMKYLISYPVGREKCDFEIPSGVEYIMPYAVSNTFNEAKLGRLTIGKDVKEVKNNAFEGSSIDIIDFSKAQSLKDIGNESFAYVYNTSGELVLPKSVECIGCKAFYGIEVSEITFETPSQCKSLGESVFAYCPNLKSVFIPNSVVTLAAPREDYLSSSGNVLAGSDKLEKVVFENNSSLNELNFKMFPNVKRLDIDFGDNNNITSVIGSCPKNLENVDFSQLTNLTLIAGSFFMNCVNLETVDLSQTKITEVGNSCFYGCTKLKEVILPDTADKIEYQAFRNCSSLEKINLDNVFRVGTNAFLGTKIDTGNISSSENTFGDFKYYEAQNHIAISGYTGSSKDIVIPDTINGKNVEVIAENAFQRKNITSVVLPSNLKRIGKYAFANNSSLTGELVIPDSVTSIESNAFYQCSGISKITLGNSLLQIGDYAFMNVGCNEITIPDSVISLGYMAFYSSWIKTINFGNGIKNIEGALDVYDYLENVNVSENNPFYSSADGVLYSKDMSVLKYYPYSKPNESFTFAYGLTEIRDNAFQQVLYLKNPVFPSTLTSIGYLGGSDSLEKLVIPSGVKNIADHAFRECKNLKSVHFEDDFSYDTLNFTFSECEKLESVTFGDNVKINCLSGTFESTAIKSIDLNCNAKLLESTFVETPLENITLYDTVETIVAAFVCTNLESIVIPSSVKAVGESAFEMCSMLSSVELGNVKSIEKYAFENCTALKTIDLTGVEIISPLAFKGCDNLTKLYFTKDEQETYITENQFNGNSVIETIVVGRSINEIQDFAFANCTNLENALIASSVTEISDTAFDNCLNLSIVCEENSYAMSYAEKNSIPYTTFVVAPIPDQKYTGAPITPTLDVTAQGNALLQGNDYVADFSDNINVGAAKVSVIGLGDYSIFAALSKFNIVKSDDVQEADTTDNTPAKPIQADNTGMDTVKAEESHQVASSASGNANLPKDSTALNGANAEVNQNVYSDTVEQLPQLQDETQETESSEDSSDAENETDTESQAENEEAQDDDLSFFKRLLIKIKTLLEKILDFLKSLFS